MAMINNDIPRGYVVGSKRNRFAGSGTKERGIVQQLMVDPDEPDWDYDMSHIASDAMMQLELLDPIDRMRSRDGPRTVTFRSTSLLPCAADTVSFAQQTQMYRNEEGSLLRKSGGTPCRKTALKKYNNMSNKKDRILMIVPDEESHHPTRLLNDAEYAVTVQNEKKPSSKKSPFHVTMPKMQPSSEIAPETEACTFSSLYPLVQRTHCGPENPVKLGHDCSAVFTIEHNNTREYYFQNDSSTTSTRSRRTRKSPTSVAQSYSNLSDDTSDTTEWELKRDLQTLKRFATMSTTPIPEESRHVVRFAHPLVTAVKQRPRTLPEDVNDLFFDQDELVTWEEDREACVYEEQVECIAVHSESNDKMSIAVTFPGLRVVSKREDMEISKSPQYILPSIEVQALPKTSVEI